MNQANEQFGPFQELWQAQETTPVEAPISRLRGESERLVSIIRKRNRRETWLTYPLAGFFLLIAIAEASSGNWMAAAGALLVSASMFWVRFVIRRWGGSVLEPEDLSRDARSFLALYRQDLVRQRRLVLHAWLWYVLPIFAGLFLLSLGDELERGESLGAGLLSVRFMIMAALAIVIVLFNLVAAWDLTRRIVELPTMDKT